MIKVFVYKNIFQGDLLISINDFFINSENIEGLLSAIRQPKCIKISVQSPVRYITVSPSVNEKEIKPENSFQAVSKNTDIVKGDRIKEVAQSFDIPHSLMILSLPVEDKSHEKKVKFLKFYLFVLFDFSSFKQIDLLYKFPPNNDLFVTIRGMFITLAGTIRDIENSEVRRLVFK
jgi:hypothetical protein